MALTLQQRLRDAGHDQDSSTTPIILHNLTAYGALSLAERYGHVVLTCSEQVRYSACACSIRRARANRTRTRVRVTGRQLGACMRKGALWVLYYK